MYIIYYVWKSKSVLKHVCMYFIKHVESGEWRVSFVYNIKRLELLKY